MTAGAAAQRQHQRKIFSCGVSAAAAKRASTAKAAAWPQPWGQWRQAWQQRGIGGSGSTVRVKVRSYSILNMSDILST